MYLYRFSACSSALWKSFYVESDHVECPKAPHIGDTKTRFWFICTPLAANPIPRRYYGTVVYASGSAFAYHSAMIVINRLRLLW